MSEFGTGYAYCLGLFLAHEWRFMEMERDTKQEGSASLRDASLWFYGASDHLFDLQIPASLPDEKRDEIAAFRDKCLAFRLCMDGQECSWSDARAACNQAKDLLREWDEFNGILSEKGDWQ
jgi:hypothetical protein